MQNTFPLLLLLLAVLLASLIFIVQAEGGWEEIPQLWERVWSMM